MSHPHVTSVYDYGESSLDGVEVPFVVMELLGGHTLEQRLEAGPLPPRASLRVCAEVASALTAAHAQGLVHRDIKPGNVMLTPTGAKVFDFGIAAAAGESEIDFEGRLLGTPTYLAPERLQAGEVLPASDVYALGLLLHRVLTGRLPWPAEAQTGMLRAHARGAGAAALIDGVPPEVHRLYRWCLARDPADRPPASAVARILLAVVSGGASEHDAVEPADLGCTDERCRCEAQFVASAAGRPDGRWCGDRRVGAGGIARRLRQSSTGAGWAVDGQRPRHHHGGDAQHRRADGRHRTDHPTRFPDRPTHRSGPDGCPGPDRHQHRPHPDRCRAHAHAGPGRTRGGARRVVTVRCVGKSVEVLEVTLAPGFRVEAYDSGPAKQVLVELTSTEHRSEIRVNCPNGLPKPKVKERAA
ncbi:serine/threonine-protein kinase [Micromonospora sp. M12]